MSGSLGDLEKLDVNMKVSAAVSVSPKFLQDLVFQWKQEILKNLQVADSLSPPPPPLRKKGFFKEILWFPVTCYERN